MLQLRKFLIASVMLIAIVFAGFEGVQAQNDTCSTSPEVCIQNEPVPYPATYPKILFIEKGTNLAFYGVIGTEPNQQIVVTYQPGWTPGTTDHIAVWALSSRASPPDFVGWTRTDRGCHQFWGYGLAKRERVCLHEWRETS